eukprot:CAMPEP_0174950644 /NCGR_PEP_ID=MMETSP1355-20121228/94439_1 /TAXON_ID=464990 /ORGANISM="Hemiselmis tepida, Strain CCMP443" /LENGTH=283 /DNA_ID=CAMNT_0016198275 /DNA_START=53 /DNA_END=905 /DNA_ORIENTATION=+
MAPRALPRAHPLAADKRHPPHPQKSTTPTHPVGAASRASPPNETRTSPSIADTGAASATGMLARRPPAPPCAACSHKNHATTSAAGNSVHVGRARQRPPLPRQCCSLLPVTAVGVRAAAVAVVDEPGGRHENSPHEVVPTPLAVKLPRAVQEVPLGAVGVGGATRAPVRLAEEGAPARRARKAGLAAPRGVADGQAVGVVRDAQDLEHSGTRQEVSLLVASNTPPGWGEAALPTLRDPPNPFSVMRLEGHVGLRVGVVGSRGKALGREGRNEAVTDIAKSAPQ